ncbi:rhodanese-like domain-containing protein [Ostreiculturibacter nitratireducens]|uniref:rhodanese-like domain-containing protein n=1 Tax=Ostreiculturibacter nitratireducens TaxID=3075226 RepID=UPI0031B6058C
MKPLAPVSRGSRLTFAALALAALSFSQAAAQDIPEAKQTRAGLYLWATEADDLLKDDHAILIDVRTRAEVAFLGLPTRANVNIPYMEMAVPPVFDPDSHGYKLAQNPDFLMEFEAYAMENDVTKDTPIVLLCRSGTRSAKAANQLYEIGYTNVYSVLDGFEGDKAKTGPHAGHRTVNGWKNAGLAWTYSIELTQAYPRDRM